MCDESCYSSPCNPEVEPNCWDAESLSAASLPVEPERALTTAQARLYAHRCNPQKFRRHFNGNRIWILLYDLIQLRHLFFHLYTSLRTFTAYVNSMAIVAAAHIIAVSPASPNTLRGCTVILAAKQ